MRNQHTFLITSHNRAVTTVLIDSPTPTTGARNEVTPAASQDMGVKHRAKRSIDVVVSGTMLAILWPLLLAISIAIRVKMGRPVLFRQSRPGLHGEPFEMVKFRTMVPGGIEDRPEGAIGDSNRVTALGAWLRSTSLDELPELVNVLKGDMSLVGPRPLLNKYLPHYNSHQMRRHEVRPGMTGLAQVEGRNDLAWPERFDTDIRYVDTWTILGDMKILLLTVKVAMGREGVEDTVENFDAWLEKRK